MERHYAIMNYFKVKTAKKSSNKSQTKKIGNDNNYSNKKTNIVNTKKIYYIIDCVFGDWKEKINNHSKILLTNDIQNIPNNVNSKIIPISLRDMIKFYNDDRLVYRTSINSMKILDNKCLFAMFMMEHFNKNIPRTIYASRYENETNIIEYIDKDYIDDGSLKMIEKETENFAGISIYIVNKLNKKPNTVVSIYVDHEIFFTGHMLVNKGRIIRQIYFKSNTDNIPNFIQCGPIQNYTIVTETELEACTNTNIFEKIFKKLNYSGFAAINFIIVNRIIIIFEINPRPGGSLIYNKSYCSDFFRAIMKEF
jgi:hypothetical protein